MQLQASGAPAKSTSYQTHGLLDSRTAKRLSFIPTTLRLILFASAALPLRSLPAASPCQCSMCTALQCLSSHAMPLPQVALALSLLALSIARAKHTQQPLLAHPDRLPAARMDPHWCRLIARPSTSGTYCCASHGIHAMLACALTCRIRVRSSSTWSTDRRRRRACPTSRHTPSGPLHPGDRNHEIYSHVP